MWDSNRIVGNEDIDNLINKIREEGIKFAKEEILKKIDLCIGYNQFNSVGKMSRMIEEKELKDKLK